MTTPSNKDVIQIESLEVATLNAIIKGQNEQVKKLYLQVEVQFIKGSSFTRSLIANKFIYPLSHLLEMNYSWGKEYLELFPPKLKSEYFRQVYAVGI